VALPAEWTIPSASGLCQDQGYTVRISGMAIHTDPYEYQLPTVLT